MEWRGEIVRLRYLAGDLACNDHPAHATRSARRQPETAAPYNAQLAVFFVWEHKRSLSSHHTTTSLSLLIYCNRVRDFCKIDTPKTMVNTPLYVPFSTSSIYRVREGGGVLIFRWSMQRERERRGCSFSGGECSQGTPFANFQVVGGEFFYF